MRALRKVKWRACGMISRRHVVRIYPHTWYHRPIIIRRLPRNVNGKVDRARLPHVTMSDLMVTSGSTLVSSSSSTASSHGRSEKPTRKSTSLESTLVDLWAEVVGAPPGSITVIDDSFILEVGPGMRGRREDGL